VPGSLQPSGRVGALPNDAAGWGRTRGKPVEREDGVLCVEPVSKQHLSPVQGVREAVGDRCQLLQPVDRVEVPLPAAGVDDHEEIEI